MSVNCEDVLVNVGSDIEEDDKLYACYCCGANFTSPHILNKHWREHYDDDSDEDSDESSNSEENNNQWDSHNQPTNPGLENNVHSVKKNPRKEKTTRKKPLREKNIQSKVKTMSKKKAENRIIENIRKKRRNKPSSMEDTKNRSSATKNLRHEALVEKNTDSSAVVKNKENIGRMKNKENRILIKKCRENSAAVKKNKVNKTIQNSVTTIKPRYKNTGEHQCEVCFKTYSTRFTLKTHAVIHSGEKAYKCQHCQREFTYEWNMKTHKCLGKQTLVGHQCDVCSKTFLTWQSLKSHALTHQDQLKGEEKVEDSGDGFSCSVCKAVFVCLSSLKVHYRSHTGDQPLTCARCRHVFYGTLKQHLEINKCNQINNTGGVSDAEDKIIPMAEATQQKSTDSKPDEPMELNSTAGLKEHHMQAHSHQKPYHCEDKETCRDGNSTQ